MIKQSWNWPPDFWERKGGWETVQALVFCCILPDITLQMQCVSWLSESVREHWKMWVIFTYSPIYTPTEGCCTSLCFAWVWCFAGCSVWESERPLLNFRDPVEVEQLLLKNAVAELGALLFFSSSGFPGHSYSPWSVCLTSISVRALFWNKSIGIHNGKCECCQLCRAVQGLLQTDRIDVEDTKCVSFSKDSALSVSKVRQ